MPRTAHWIHAALASVMLLPAVVVARDCEGLDWEEGDAARVATVTSPETRTFFLRSASETAGCPSAAAACRLRAFLVPDDEAIAWFVDGDYACVSFSGAKGRVTSGFMPVASLSLAEALPATTQAYWLGTWSRDEAEVRITADGNAAIAVEGDATWGTHDAERIERGGVHTGTIERTSVALGKSPVVRFAMGADADWPDEEFRCKVALQRVGDWLLVDDNFQCGGANVSFDGMYTRTAD